MFCDGNEQKLYIKNRATIIMLIVYLHFSRVLVLISGQPKKELNKLDGKGNCLSAVVEQQQSYEITQNDTIDILLDTKWVGWNYARATFTIPYPVWMKWTMTYALLEVVNSSLYMEQTTPNILRRTYNVPSEWMNASLYKNSALLNWLIAFLLGKIFTNLFNDISNARPLFIIWIYLYFYFIGKHIWIT